MNLNKGDKFLVKMSDGSELDLTFDELDGNFIQAHKESSSPGGKVAENYRININFILFVKTLSKINPIESSEKPVMVERALAELKEESKRNKLKNIKDFISEKKVEVTYELPSFKKYTKS